VAKPYARAFRASDNRTSGNTDWCFPWIGAIQAADKGADSGVSPSYFVLASTNAAIDTAKLANGRTYSRATSQRDRLRMGSR
jgi:hypothetical protein